MTGNTQKAASAATQSTSSTPQPSSTLVSVLDHGAFAQEIEDCVKEMSAADVPVEPSSGARLCQKLFLGECGKLRINAASGLLDDDYNAALEKVLALKDRMVNYYSASASASGGAPSGAGGAAGGAAAATVPQLKKRLREAAADPTQADGGVTAGVGGAERALKQAGSSIFELIKDKPMYVECFTPCLQNHLTTLVKEQKAIAGISSELLQHSGDLADLPAADFETADVGPVLSNEVSAEDLDRLRASLVAKLDALRVAARALRDTGKRLQRLFWLGEFSQGCNWETVLQLLHREAHDEMGKDLHP